MMNLKLAILTVTICLAGALSAFGQSGEQPAKIAPGLLTSNDHFYVMGPKGAVTSGRDDSLQVVFFRLPITEQDELYLFVNDPGAAPSGGLLSFMRSSVETTYSIYGGAGAFLGDGSRSVRPAARQPGKLLARQHFADDDKAWVSFGPFNVGHGEQIDGYAYFKLVAEATAGDGINLFKVGISNRHAEIFTYDATLRLGGVTGDQLQVMVDVPPGTRMVKEYNFDFDDGGTPSFGGLSLIASISGRWTGNEVSTAGMDLSDRISYVLHRGPQQRPNLGFHFTDGDNRPLAMFFPGPVTPIYVERLIPQEIPPVTMAAAPVQAEPPTKQDGNCAFVDGFLANLTACLPPQVVIGEEFPGTITIYGKQEARDVTVTTELPPGLTYLSSTPPAAIDQQRLTWEFSNLMPGQEILIDLRLRADAEGTLTHCPRITARQVICQPLSVAKPSLTLTKRGPAKADLGSEVTYVLTVTNTSKTMARNVVLTDQLPAGLQHVSENDSLVYRLGDLKPGETRNVTVTVKAAESGEHVNKAVAVAEHADPARAEILTQVTRPRLDITKTGTEQQYVGKNAEYQIAVSNPGDTTLTNLTIVDQLPPDTTLVSAGGGEAVDRQVSWHLAELAPGKSHTFKLQLTATISGTTINSVRVTSAEGLEAGSQTWTRWIGHPGLLIEVVDTQDPLTVGQTTTYKILVTNQGTAPDTNVRITANFPPQLKPVKAEGSTVTRVAGRTVSVAPIDSLAPGKSATWTIEARAEKVGDGRVHVDLTSQMLSRPVTEVESTHVY